MTASSPQLDLRLRREALVFLPYFVIYVAYLFATLESEWWHWASLVILPLLLIIILRRSRENPLPFRAALASVGLQRNSIWQGMIGAFVLGCLLAGVQLIGSRQRDMIFERLSTWSGVSLLPVVFGLMLVTAAFTEEFFFRGVLQTRLAALLRSRILGLLVTATLFGLYHVPYAYLNPHWPSHGDWQAAFASALSQGISGGLVLGLVYEFSRRNLLAGVLVHALINTLPALASLRIRGLNA